MRQPKPRPKRKPWELNTLDFFHAKVYAQKRTRRYELFFNYLRISPSYFLALESEKEEELAEKLGDTERAAQVWKVREDVGDVYSVMFKEWWLSSGINLFGIHTRRPHVSPIAYVPGGRENSELSMNAYSKFREFVESSFEEQGRPDSILFSVPLGQGRAKTSKELFDLVAKYELRYPVTPPSPKYTLEKNRIQDKRLMTALDLVFFKAAFPGWELWRAGAQARISPKHADINPLLKKKDIHSAEGRRSLTMTASRMLREAMVIAENAAIGRFPCIEPIEVAHLDIEILGRKLSSVHAWEKEERMRMQTEENQRRSVVLG